ncbi:MAG TPA: choice-of-anchor P family protein [Solirubrobacteraceae bacterium]|nr:choice-of-anchor P family protein [Solirubrobacteraceae bacterium]
MSSVSGGAYAISASANPLVAPVAVGALPSVTLPAEGGGPFAETLVSANLVGLAPFGVARVSTEGNSGRGSATSSATILDASVAGVLTAGAIRSRCSARTGDAEGTAAVADLVVGGVPIATVHAGPNTEITLPAGRVILNEQEPYGNSGVVVNAVRVTLDSLPFVGDVVLGQSRCAVNTTSTRSRARALRRAHRRHTS